MGKSSARLLLTLAPFLCASCSTSTQTSMSAPDSPRCQATLNTTAASFNASGGIGTVTVSTARDCPWTASAGVGWISINGPASGQGDGSVSYSVAPNVVPSPRSGALIVASTPVQLNQAGVPCQFALSQTDGRVGPAGGPINVGVSTLSGCAWSATAIDPWISIVSGQSGNASGNVTLWVAANTGKARTGSVSIAGLRFTVSQTGGDAPGPTDPPEKVHLEGLALLVTGRCPNLQFVVSGNAVVTDSNTDFRKKASCEDLSAGDSVTVDGIRDGVTVRAQSIEFQKKG
jgi:uncharacterized protein DUF5666/all-beta uncharacterized protein